MRAMLTIGSLLIVLAIIGLALRSQLQASKRFLPSAAVSDASSAPFGGSRAPTVAQFQRELDKTMQQAAQQSAERAATADSDVSR